MMKKIVSIILAVTAMMQLNAAPGNWEQANDLYAKGKFIDASRLYEDILKEDGPAPELFYNLGNVYYKLNETARSILNYERALSMSPMYEDARVNLELANAKIVDNIALEDSFFLRHWYDVLVSLLSSNQWFWISWAMFIVFLSGVYFFIFGNSEFLRKTFFYVGLVFLAVSIITFTFSGVRKTQQITKQKAIVMTGVVVVKSSPDKSGTDLFQLHEGTKVAITSQLGDWTEIRLGNGNVGWLESSSIEGI